VLQALTKLDPVLAEFQAASDRPHNRYPHHYEEGFSAVLNSVGHIRSKTRSLALRSAARLAEGQIDQAAADVVLAFRLGDSLREDPYQISQLVRYACDTIGAIEASTTGLARGCDPRGSKSTGEARYRHYHAAVRTLSAGWTDAAGCGPSHG
jgi:hypothetical protein